MIGKNIKRIRDDVRGMKGSDLSDRLNETRSEAVYVWVSEFRRRHVSWGRRMNSS